MSSIPSKVFEWVLLDQIGLCSGVHQFGFKRGNSCSDCSFVLRECIDYYLWRGNGTVYVSTLDLSKAYDRVSHYRLFSMLHYWILMLLCTVLCEVTQDMVYFSVDASEVE